jgi:DNA-binding protein Fis
LAPVRVARAKVRDLESLCSELVSLGLSDVKTVDGELYDRVVKMVEKELISQVLRISQGTQTKAATRLGINRNTLHKKIEDSGLASEVR